MLLRSKYPLYECYRIGTVLCARYIPVDKIDLVSLVLMNLHYHGRTWKGIFKSREVSLVIYAVKGKFRVQGVKLKGESIYCWIAKELPTVPIRGDSVRGGMDEREHRVEYREIELTTPTSFLLC